MNKTTLQCIKKLCLEHDCDCMRGESRCPLLDRGDNRCLVSRQPHEWDPVAIHAAEEAPIHICPIHGTFICASRHLKYHCKVAAYRMANEVLRVLSKLRGGW